MENALWHSPAQCHDEGGHGWYEVRSVHHDRETRIGLGEVAGLDLNPERRTRDQSPDKNLIRFVVRKWPEQAALLERRQSSAHFQLTPEPGDSVFIGDFRAKGQGRRTPTFAEPIGEFVEGHQVFGPLVSWDRMDWHVRDEHLATANVHGPSGFLFECRCINDQREWTEPIAVQMHGYDELIGCKQVFLVDVNRCLEAVKSSLGLDLQCEIGAIAEPMNHGVDPAVEQRQEDVQAAARLGDQWRPYQELGCLPDGVLTAVRPAGV